LTVTLLISTIARMESSTVSEPTLTRWRHYLDVLKSETTRLSDCLNDIHALTERGDAVRERIDLCAVLRDAIRVLRHEATMRETAIELDVPPEPAWVTGDPHQLRRRTVVPRCADSKRHAQQQAAGASSM
jgi:signal transduction histidine kinase